MILVAVFSLSFASCAFFIFLVCGRVDKRLLVGACLLAAVYLGLDDFATGMGSLWRPLGGEWNWSGKVLSLALAACVAGGLRLSAEAIGLTFKQRNLLTSLVAIVILTLASFKLGLIYQPGVPSLETLLFQAFMPSLAEELAYRGVAPAILLRKGDEGIPWAVVVGTAVVFGLWHGLSFADGQFAFDAMSALFPFLGGIAYGWLRFHSGSLVMPILAHSLGNVTFHLSGYL